VKRNGVRVEAQPRLLLYDARALAILARWIAIAVAITVVTSAGKQARILIKCTLLHPEDETTIL
jgi:hypothetical protein